MTAERDTDLDALILSGKALGVFDESRAREFLDVTVARGRAMDALAKLVRDARDERDVLRDASLDLLREVSSWGEAIDAYVKNGDGDGAILVAQAIGERVDAAELRLAAIHGVEWTGHAWALKPAPKAERS